MVVWWLCLHRTILIRNIRQKQYSQFPTVHDFRKPWWGVAYVPCITNLQALYAWAIWWHVTCMLSLAEHWQGRRALSNHVCAHSVISMWHVVCLQHLARACIEQSRSTSVLPINHVIQMPQCLSGFVNHDYWSDWGLTECWPCPCLRRWAVHDDWRPLAGANCVSAGSSLGGLRHHWCKV